MRALREGVGHLMVCLDGIKRLLICSQSADSFGRFLELGFWDFLTEPIFKFKESTYWILYVTGIISWKMVHATKGDVKNCIVGFLSL